MRHVRFLLAAAVVAAVSLPAFAQPPVPFGDAGLHAVQFVDAREGWACGDDGAVWHSIDGGKAWERQTTGTRASLRGLHFVNPYCGWAVGRTDAPGGTFRHWGVYDIPPTVTGLHEGAGNEASFMQAENSFGSTGYRGPCPPKGDKPHRYRFKLFALDVQELDVGAKPKVEDLEKALGDHVLAQAEVVAPFGH